MKRYPNYINGEWVDSPQALVNLNPSDTRDQIGEFAEATPEQVTLAVQAALKAAPEWAQSTPQERFNVLDAAGSEILARKEELGRLLSREEGKTLAEGMGEVARAGQIFKFFAGEALRLAGEHLDSVRPGVEVDIRREPLGVVALITPWNFPIAIPAWKIAPALAFGNAVVFKPAEQAPASAWMLAEILSRCGLPAGAFNMVMGRGSRVGQTLVEQKGISGISFTGSFQIGRRIARMCAERLVRVQLEMGGKNPLVVLDDAPLEQAVEIAVNGAFFSAGERCTASSRIIVTRGIYQRFKQALIERMKKLRVGDALDPETDIGPVIDEAQMNKVLHYIELGRQEGATLAAGGKRLELDKPGYYLEPTLFTETHNGMRINREEIFGPVATLIPVEDYQEALNVANDTEYGLSAGICTAFLEAAHHFRRHVRAGLAMVNLPTAGVDYHVPFGGTKGSSFGTREQGRYAVEFYTTVKTCYTRW
ncbi:MAG: aldehyde dehydrogenase family protein [Calditrichaeota bacterium]|nr:MAG: aldehyde dehydrogenase family protein [Calditrichota bacterium]